MSSVSDHIQLMKSQENKYDSVFNKRECLFINDTTPNTIKARASSKLLRFLTTPIF